VLYGRDLCRSGGPGKQKPRTCRAQELARSSGRENERPKKGDITNSATQSLASSAGRGGRVVECLPTVFAVYGFVEPKARIRTLVTVRFNIFGK
jgi:hypothetical protein